MMGTRWQALGCLNTDFNRLQTEFTRILEQLAGGDCAKQFSRHDYPPLNIWEEENALYVEAELPGYSLEDLEIYVQGNNELTLKGRRTQPDLEGGKWHRQERGFGEFDRTVELPEDVDADNVSASFKQGVLRVTLPKKEDDKPRRVQVNVE